MTETVRKHIEDAEELNAQEELLGWEATDFSTLHGMKERLKAIR